MDILYYSNYCNNCQILLQYLAKHSLTNKLNFICIDKREYDSNTNNTYIILENQKILMPPNIYEVPTLLLVKQKYNIIKGKEIIEYLNPYIENINDKSNSEIKEPQGYVLNNVTSNSNIISGNYTYFNDKKISNEQNNYVSSNHIINKIESPPENYKPDKVSDDNFKKFTKERDDDNIKQKNEKFVYCPNI